MSLQTKENTLRNFKLGLFVKDPPSPIVLIQLEDGLGNELEDGVGNKLVFPQ